MYISLMLLNFISRLFYFIGSEMRLVFVKYCLINLFLFFCATNCHAEQVDGLFGSTEYKSSELSAFKKWASLRARHQNDLNKTHKPVNVRCRRTKNFKCVSEEWREMIDGLKKGSDIKKLTVINEHLNRSPYITDMINWQQNDYWATIRQFFDKDGDCEDYAIAKYYSLIEVGFRPDQMRIAVVHDKNLDVAHAVLAVYLEDKVWILDNQISNIVMENNVIHYQPLYSINEQAWWLHKSS